MRSRTCVKRNAGFGARFKGLSLYFLYQKGNLIRIKMGLDTYLILGIRKRGLLEKGSFQKSPFSRDSREFRDSGDSREPPDCGKEWRIRGFFRDSREFRDFRDSGDSSSKKTPFVMTPFPGPEMRIQTCTPLSWYHPYDYHSHKQNYRTEQMFSVFMQFHVMHYMTGKDLPRIVIFHVILFFRMEPRKYPVGATT